MEKLELNYYLEDHAFFPVECDKTDTVSKLLDRIKEREKKYADEIEDFPVRLKGRILNKDEKLSNHIDSLSYNAIYISDEPLQEIILPKMEKVNVDNYTNIEKVKVKGGYNSYVGNDKKTNKKVFIQIYNNHPRSAYLNMTRGIYIMRLLNFPGIQKVLGYRFSIEESVLESKFGRFYNNEQTAFILFITEFMKNGSVPKNVRNYLMSNGQNCDKMNPTIRSKIIFGIAAILKRIHQNKIVHRHLAPDSVFLDDNFEPIICDFKYANFMSDKRDHGFYTGDSIYSNTLKLPPEFFNDDKLTISSSFDVYSYGFLLYRMFSNTIEFEKKKIRTPQQFIMQITRGKRPNKPKDIPEHYWNLIQNCWKQNYLDRPTFKQITEILKDDKYALEEFGMKTDLEQLHEYQKRIDPDFQADEISSLKAEIAKLKQKIKSTENHSQGTFTILDSKDISGLREIREISTGGGGRVLEVGKETSYALKIMHVTKDKCDIKKIKQFMKEYEILNNLNHPNIVRTYGFFMGDEKAAPSILLEFCKQDLTDAIKPQNHNTNDKIVIWVYQIMEAMKYVHKCKIIHRDLKPSNILIGSDGLIRITDFGISKLMTLEEQSTTLGSGTQKFMAPELLNEEKYDEKVDVYSFGVVLYYIISSGEMPKINVVQMGNGKKAPIPPSFTEVAKNIINDCWNRQPQDRPSFEKLIQILEENKYGILQMSNSEIKNVELFVKDHKDRIQS